MVNSTLKYQEESDISWSDDTIALWRWISKEKENGEYYLNLVHDH